MHQANRRYLPGISISRVREILRHSANCAVITSLRPPASKVKPLPERRGIAGHRSAESMVEGGGRLLIEMVLWRPYIPYPYDMPVHIGTRSCFAKHETEIEYGQKHDQRWR